MTLSSLYLDIIKDRLYCDGADSAARRSAQSALWIILDAMTKVFAPILAFTCDEIWLQMPHRDGDDGRNVLLNQMSKPYADYALSDTEMAVWETAPAEGAVVGQGVNFPGLTIAVTEAKGTKCPRCAAVCKSLGVVFE